MAARSFAETETTLPPDSASMIQSANPFLRRTFGDEPGSPDPTNDCDFRIEDIVDRMEIPVVLLPPGIGRDTGPAGEDPCGDGGVPRGRLGLGVIVEGVGVERPLGPEGASTHRKKGRSTGPACPPSAGPR